MKKHLKTILQLAAGAFIVTGCSITKNLPEGEVLYTGIDKIVYEDNTQKKNKKKEEEGVITALSEAYQTIDKALT